MTTAGRLLGGLVWCSAVVGGGASAQAYVGIDAGWADASDVDFVLTNAAIPPHPTTFGSGWLIGLRGGWQFAPAGPGRPRAELALSWREHPVDRFGSTGDVGAGAGRLRATALMLNGLYDVDTGTRWTPYLGLGLGSLRVRASDIRRDIDECCTGIVAGKDSGTAWQAMLGLAYQFDARTALSLDLRHLASSGRLDYGYRVGCQPDGSFCVGVPGSTSARYTSRALAVGVRHSF
jgi:opacity protein-like surface antigen